MDALTDTDPIERLREALGPGHVLTGEDAAPYGRDWTRTRVSHPLAVVRPACAAEVSMALRIASAAGLAVVPVAGNTGLTGAAQAEGALMVSLERMTAIREIREDERVAVVEAGVVLQSLQDAAEARGLAFPLFFGARGSARLGGALSTNAGGSNVLRHGSARALCLGLEVVLADGRVLDLMGALHKDNSGYALRDLFVGAEGTLGLITAAVVKLSPLPRARATAMVAAPSLTAALGLLRRLQDETAGQVEAFEWMPRAYIEAHLAHDPGAREPFDAPQEVNILVEVAATSARDAEPLADGTVPVVAHLEAVLAALMEDGAVLDARVARSEAQRGEMWARREAAAELVFTGDLVADHDVAVPLARVAEFVERADAAAAEVAPGARSLSVAHLGDGNVHYTVLAPGMDAGLKDAITRAVEAVVLDLGGTFSAEHGVGTHKLGSMARMKGPVALDVMRAVKAALDPQGIMNPGKVLPPG